MSGLVVDYCGEIHDLAPGDSLTIGRDADLVVDDNPFLHRRLVELLWDGGFWWVVNVGTRISLTVAGGAGSLQSWVAPGSRVPVVLPEVSVLFSAGETTYEIDLRCPTAAFDALAAGDQGRELRGDLTLGAVPLTSSQLRLLLALAEDTLRRAGDGSSQLPTNAAAAARLGWSKTTFNRKLDNLCDKFTRAGVKGLHGRPGELAVNRRARLVEYVVAARIVHVDQLALLDQPEETAL